VVVGQVIDRDDLKVRADSDQSAVVVATDAAEPVDANLDSHVQDSFSPDAPAPGTDVRTLSA